MVGGQGGYSLTRWVVDGGGLAWYDDGGSRVGF